MEKKISKNKELVKKPKCGLCGSSKKLVKTSCCDNWICDNEDNYVMFSYARNSCIRNHRRLTLCALHSNEEHQGPWKTCKECFGSLEHELEMYAWYGTNEYNFEKLENPPRFKNTYCSKCGDRIVLPDGGYSVLCDVYLCYDCGITQEERERIIMEYEKKKLIKM